MAEAVQWPENGVAEDPAVVPVTDDLRIAWARIQRCVEFHNPTLDADVALVAAHVEASAREHAALLNLIAACQSMDEGWLAAALALADAHAAMLPQKGQADGA